VTKECFGLIIYRDSSHSTAIIPTLESPALEAAVDSYADALKAVFICQAAVNIICLLSCVPIQESARLYVLLVISANITDDSSIWRSQRHDDQQERQDRTTSTDLTD
jgi:hypothetical protein